MRRWLLGCFKEAWDGWCRFWFEADAVLPAKTFRMAFALLVFTFQAMRTSDLELFYSEQGIVPLEVVRNVMDLKLRFSLLHHVTGLTALWGVHLLFLGTLLALAFGFWAPVTSILAYVLHVSFLHRDMAVAYGMDLISTFFLFNLILMSWGRGKALTSMGLRLCQLQVCIIYGFSGLEKLRGVQWYRGDALWTVLANAQLTRFDFGWAANFPVLLGLATVSTLLWEIYFPAMVWIRKLRYPVLFFGILLHLGIALSVNIPFFAMLMIVSYITFIPSEDLARVTAALRPRTRKISQVQPSSADQSVV